jgi:hypothetical protein
LPGRELQAVPQIVEIPESITFLPVFITAAGVAVFFSFSFGIRIGAVSPSVFRLGEIVGAAQRFLSAPAIDREHNGGASKQFSGVSLNG